MRKRTVKNLCKEVFWHIVYFLPVVIALFTMLLFTTENYAEYIVSGESVQITEENVTDLTGTTWTFNDSIIIEYGEDFSYVIDFESNNLTFSKIQFTTDYTANGGTQSVYINDDSDLLVYDSLDFPSWSFDAYKVIYIVSGEDVQNVGLIDFLKLHADMDALTVGVSSQSVFGLVSDAFDSSFNVIGLNFENDYLYSALKQVFVNGGILAVFNDVSALLKFAVYYFYVHIIHLFIDALLFIPKLAHKWIDSLTRCE